MESPLTIAIMASECPICYESITATSGITTLSCSHSFHYGCISGWFLNQDVGTCPCCRKEMTTTEDLPRNDAESTFSDDSDEDDDDDEEYAELEVRFNREKFGDFLKERGGVGMLEAISDGWTDAATVTFTRTQLHFLMIGNGAKPLTDEEWEAILEDDDAESTEEGEIQEMSITTSINEDGSFTRMIREARECEMRESMLAYEKEEAATRLQAVWRGFQRRIALMEKRAVHILANMAS